MDIGLSKCAVLMMKRGKVITREGTDMPDPKMMKCIEKKVGIGFLGTWRRME